MQCRATFCAALVTAIAAAGCNSLIGAGAPDAIVGEAPEDTDPIDQDPQNPGGAVCGDNKTQGDEECDDANSDPHDGCDRCIKCGAAPGELYDNRTGHCYLINGQVAEMPNGLMEGMTWEAANDACNENWRIGSTLVVVNSADEVALIQELVMHFASKMSQDLNQIDVWIGAEKTSSEPGAIAWATGEIVEFPLPWIAPEEADKGPGFVALDGAFLGFFVVEPPMTGALPSLPYICEHVPVLAPADPPPVD